jgi:ubiquinone/menaquinone biosynthesis C-methylase UbiE
MEAVRDSHQATNEAYEAFMGQWSRHVAPQFLDWLDLPDGLDWLDVGCGTGVLSQIILERCAPNSIVGIDPLEKYIACAQAITEAISFRVGDMQDLPFEKGQFDSTVSALCIKFVPDKARGISELARVTRTGGSVALYDWDLSNEGNMTRHFWQAVAEALPELSEERAQRRAAKAAPEEMLANFESAGLKNVETKLFSFTARFDSVDSYWAPLLGNEQNVGRFCRTLNADQLATIRQHLDDTLPVAADGTIAYEGRAWAIRSIA